MFDTNYMHCIELFSLFFAWATNYQEGRWVIILLLKPSSGCENGMFCIWWSCHHMRKRYGGCEPCYKGLWPRKRGTWEENFPQTASYRGWFVIPFIESKKQAVRIAVASALILFYLFRFEWPLFLTVCMYVYRAQVKCNNNFQLNNRKTSLRDMESSPIPACQNNLEELITPNAPMKPRFHQHISHKEANEKLVRRLIYDSEDDDDAMDVS